MRSTAGSRAIAASLHRSGIAFRSATFSDHVGNTDNDARIAESIASLDLDGPVDPRFVDGLLVAAAAKA